MAHVWHLTMAFHCHRGTMRMMAKGFGNQSDRKQKPLSSQAVSPPPAPKSPSVGDLPEDDFSQFPPLTPEQQKSLVGARGGGKGLPAEVRWVDSHREWYAVSNPLIFSVYHSLFRAFCSLGLIG